MTGYPTQEPTGRHVTPGSKINFFRQAPTKHCAVVNKIYPLQQNTNRWKTLVANFFFKNQNEESVFGAAVVIFPLTNKIKYKLADYLYINIYH